MECRIAPRTQRAGIGPTAGSPADAAWLEPPCCSGRPRALSLASACSAGNQDSIIFLQMEIYQIPGGVPSDPHRCAPAGRVKFLGRLGIEGFNGTISRPIRRLLDLRGDIRIDIIFTESRLIYSSGAALTWRRPGTHSVCPARVGECSTPRSSQSEASRSSAENTR